MKHFHVTCAIIEIDGKVLSTQRSAAMSLPLKWEFPGGKINDGELPADCLRRELIEELGLYITVGRALPPHTHRYRTFTVTLHPFVCAIASGEITLHEHAAFSWLPPEELHTLDWAEADLPVIQTYTDSLKAAIT
jgi:8-oxo-dGTP diphosphatase